MYDITALEQKWQVYNSNKKKRVVAILSVLIFTLTISVYFILNIKPQQQADLTPNKEVVLEKNITTFAKTNLELVVPVITFEQNISTTPQKETILDAKPKNQESVELTKKTYSENKNFKTTIELAKAYYSSGDYEKARFFAIEANSIDSSKEDGWIVFANSCVKLGLKNDAIVALSKFNQAGGTQKTKELEKELKNQWK